MADNWLSLFRRTPPKSVIEEHALTPADENPWYCVATIHGEQPIEGFDDDLARKNYQVWSRWVGGALNAPGGERAEFERNFANRTGGSLKIPDPDAIVDFSNTHFVRPVNFLSFGFPRAVNFSSATFSAEAHFRGAAFNSKSDFGSATFSGETNFSSAQFSAGVDFHSATFSKKVDFHSANFASPNFRSVIFSNYANFNHAKFSGSTADFGAAVFSNGTDFASAVFSNGADFASAAFFKTVSFNAAKFNMVNFSAATFSDPIQFINAEFTGSTIFANACFEAHVPDFRGAKMHEATEWHGVTWPKPPGSKEDAHQQVYGYERLKQEMEQRKKHEDEQKFFRKELRARRGLLRTLSGEWLLNAVYQLLSDYGNSFMAPVFWLLVVFAAGIVTFARAPLYCGAPMPIKLAIKLSFANIFVFLPDYKREIMMTNKMVDCLSNTTQAVSAAQSLLGVVLLFLLGLALRNRFRMR